MQRMNVVLPEPDGPMMQTTSRPWGRRARRPSAPRVARSTCGRRLASHDGVASSADERSGRSPGGDEAFAERELVRCDRSRRGAARSQAWMMLQIVVRTRYQNATALKYSTLKRVRVADLGVGEQLVHADRERDSEVVLSMLLNSLPSGGTITRAACGRTIRRIASAVGHPERLRRLHLAASIESMPARMISRM